MWPGRLACILEGAQGGALGEAARQGGDLLSQDADLHLVPLVVALGLRGRGGLAGREQARERREDGVRNVASLDFAAPWWLLQEGAEVIVMQGAVQRDVAHVRHGQAVGD